MTNFFIDSKKITCIGELKGTPGRLFVVEFCNDIISGLMNDINASIFVEDIIGHTCSDYCHIQRVWTRLTY